MQLRVRRTASAPVQYCFFRRIVVESTVLGFDLHSKQSIKQREASMPSLSLLLSIFI
jgi:hypothetical protein